MSPGGTGWPPGAISSKVNPSCFQPLAALAGTLNSANRSDHARRSPSPGRTPSCVQIWSADRAPIPGRRRTIRLKATSSRGLTMNFRKAATSLTCACSKNRSPLVIWNGIPSRVSSICSSIEWKCARYNTATSWSSIPSSRRSSIRRATKAACWPESPSATHPGRTGAAGRTATNSFRNWRSLKAIAAFATARISGTLR